MGRGVTSFWPKIVSLSAVRAGASSCCTVLVPSSRRDVGTRAASPQTSLKPNAAPHRCARWWPDAGVSQDPHPVGGRPPGGRSGFRSLVVCPRDWWSLLLQGLMTGMLTGQRVNGLGVLGAPPCPLVSPLQEVRPRPPGWGHAAP